MTREDAITYLKVIWNRYKAEYEIERETLDAYNMAIESLQADPKTKCVARIDVDTEEVVKRIKEEYDITDGWIPVSDRLPNGYEFAIVSVLDNSGDLPWEYTTVAWRCNGVWISDNDILCGTVVAWMPLPEPYRESEKNHEG